LGKTLAFHFCQCPLATQKKKKKKIQKPAGPLRFIAIIHEFLQWFSPSVLANAFSQIEK